MVIRQQNVMGQAAIAATDPKTKLMALGHDLAKQLKAYGATLVDVSVKTMDHNKSVKIFALVLKTDIKDQTEIQPFLRWVDSKKMSKDPPPWNCISGISVNDNPVTIELWSTLLANPGAISLRFSESSNNCKIRAFMGDKDIGHVYFGKHEKIEDPLHPWLHGSMNVFDSGTDYPGNGYGFLMYKRAIEMATQLGYVLLPDYKGGGHTSAAAKRMWWEILWKQFPEAHGGLYDPSQLKPSELTSHLLMAAKLIMASSKLQTLAHLKSIRHELASVAQKVYDDWQQDENGEDQLVGVGGICHIIAEEMNLVLDRAGIEATTISSNQEVHVYCVAQLVEGVFTVDIPYRRYERGDAYSWTKIPGVHFTANDVQIDRLSTNPEDFSDYTEGSVKVLAATDPKTKLSSLGHDIIEHLKNCGVSAEIKLKVEPDKNGVKVFALVVATNAEIRDDIDEKFWRWSTDQGRNPLWSIISYRSIEEKPVIIDLHSTLLANPADIKLRIERDDGDMVITALSSGMEIGTIGICGYKTIVDPANPWLEGSMSVVNSHTQYPGNGFGYLMYKKAIEEASLTGRILLPDYKTGGDTSRAARRLWEILWKQYPELHGGLYDPKHIRGGVKAEFSGHHAIRELPNGKYLARWNKFNNSTYGWQDVGAYDSREAAENALKNYKPA